jgi:hypothetical protein
MYEFENLTDDEKLFLIFLFYILQSINNEEKKEDLNNVRLL